MKTHLITSILSLATIAAVLALTIPAKSAVTPECLAYDVDLDRGMATTSGRRLADGEAPRTGKAFAESEGFRSGHRDLFAARPSAIDRFVIEDSDFA